jgi:copper chaperone NosL
LAGLIDFYRWGYNYGHNLDPNAAIQVPGMTYQPPLIGYKNLLNFTAYSGPDVGGWILIASGTLAGLLLGWEQFLRGRAQPSGSTRPGDGAAVARVAVVTLLAASAGGCNSAPEPFRYGQDECVECKMTITDRRFGAQLITQKGKALKFDDFRCLRTYTARAAVPKDRVRSQFASDFQRPGQFIPLQDAWFLTSAKLKSPMGSDTAAFASGEELRRVREELGEGSESRWAELETKL